MYPYMTLFDQTRIVHWQIIEENNYKLLEPSEKSDRRECMKNA